MVLENAVKAWAVARYVHALYNAVEIVLSPIRPTPSRESTLRLAKQEAQRLAGDAEERPSRPKKRRRLVRSSGDSSSDGVEIVDGPSTSRHTEKSESLGSINALLAQYHDCRAARNRVSPHTRLVYNSVHTANAQHLRRYAQPSLVLTPPLTDNSAGLVDCPMCQRRVPLQIINQHIDSRCKLTAPPSPRRPKGKAKQEWSKILGGDHRPGKERTREKSRLQPDEDSEPDYLPTVSYHTLKDKRVQELLHEHGLPTTGDRPAWVRRHRQCVDC